MAGAQGYERLGRGLSMPDLTVLEGDCLDRLAELPADSVNLIITSPPYAQQRSKTYGGVPAGEYVEWFLPRADQMKRVLRPDGSFVLNIKEHAEDGERHRYVYELVLAMRDAGWRLVDELVWYKKSVFPHPHKSRLDDTWERLYHFTKAVGHAMCKDAVKVKSTAQPRWGKYSDGKSPAGFSINPDNDDLIDPEWVYPRNVLWLDKARTNDSQHPAVFPATIPEFFIKLFTQPGDTVLDPFAGSGTTLIQAYEMDRHSIGIEVMPEYCQLIRNRRAALSLRLPGLEETL